MCLVEKKAEITFKIVDHTSPSSFLLYKYIRADIAEAFLISPYIMSACMSVITKTYCILVLKKYKMPHLLIALGNMLMKLNNCPVINMTQYLYFLCVSQVCLFVFIHLPSQIKIKLFFNMICILFKLTNNLFLVCFNLTCSVLIKIH